MKIDKFNIRVYGIILKDDKVLVLNEMYAGKNLQKFPGGGLEFGEGTLDCLKRELLEELNIKLISAEHFYTQEDFVQSLFRENEQIFTIYYLAKCDLSEQKISEKSIFSTEWISLKDKNYKMQLPVDQIVMQKLQNLF